jgi:hypothetical protein
MGYILHFFSPMRYASAKSIEVKEASHNNLPTPTDDVIVNPKNPVNPDSKPRCSAHNVYLRFSNMGVFWGYFLKIILNQDF